MKNLRFDARRGTSMPYDSPTPDLTRQLRGLGQWRNSGKDRYVWEEIEE